jgi:signal transduction histidine kinase
VEGTVLVERSPVELAALLDVVREVGVALALGKPVELRLEVEGPLEVHGAAAALRQVFLNLVSNAVKFTESGTVTVRAARSTDGQSVEIQVEDTGVGIEPEELPRVFDRFYRGEAARGRPAGTGLGLAIARLIVEQHGGVIEVVSEAGRGSRFTVRLPVHPPEDRAGIAPGEAGQPLLGSGHGEG